MTNADLEDMQAIAANFYNAADEKPPAVKEFYQRLARYMQTGVAAIYHLSEAKEIFYAQDGKVTVEHRLWALQWLNSLGNLPFIEPTKYGFGQHSFIAGDNPVGVGSMTELQCLDCGTVPKTTDRVWAMPVTEFKSEIVCASCAAKRIAKYEAEHGEITIQ
jgi:hypothetical protein